MVLYYMVEGWFVKPFFLLYNAPYQFCSSIRPCFVPERLKIEWNASCRVLSEFDGIFRAELRADPAAHTPIRVDYSHLLFDRNGLKRAFCHTNAASLAFLLVYRGQVSGGGQLLDRLPACGKGAEDDSSPAPGLVMCTFFVPSYQAGSWVATFASTATVRCLARRLAIATTVTVGGRPHGSGMIVVSMQ